MPRCAEIAGGFGAEIADLDLNEPITRDTARWLCAMLESHSLLLFRDQPIDTERQFSLGKALGAIDERLPTRALESIRAAEQGKAHYVSNTRPDGILPNGELGFHTDLLFYEPPGRGVILHALETPSAGGDTVFIDLVRTAAAFPAALRSRLEGLSAFHIFDYDVGAKRAARSAISDVPADTAQAVHPVLFKGLTGRTVPWIARTHTMRIMELDIDDSNALIDEVCDRIAASPFRYAHHWSPGDTVIWDNWVTQHGRTDFDPREPRTLRRVPLHTFHA